jgi:hypothetical protein
MTSRSVVPPRRLSIADLMALVAFAAVDCLVIPVVDHFAAALLLGFALQAGLLLLLRSRGRRRYFLSGFEVVGGALLLTFFACKTVAWATMCRWPSYLFDNAYSPIEIHGELKVYEWVIVFEVSYGLPMFLLALTGGLLAACLHRGQSDERFH